LKSIFNFKNFTPQKLIQPLLCPESTEGHEGRNESQGNLLERPRPGNGHLQKQQHIQNKKQAMCHAKEVIGRGHVCQIFEGHRNEEQYQERYTLGQGRKPKPAHRALQGI